MLIVGNVNAYTYAYISIFYCYYIMKCSVWWMPINIVYIDWICLIMQLYLIHVFYIWNTVESSWYAVVQACYKQILNCFVRNSYFLMIPFLQNIKDSFFNILLKLVKKGLKELLNTFSLFSWEVLLSVGF